MFKKPFNIMLSALCCTALLASCGGNSGSNSSSESTEETAEKGSITVSPENTSIGGKFGKAFDIEDRDYTVNYEKSVIGDDKEIKMSVTFTRNDALPSVNFDEIAGSSDAGKKYLGKIEAEFLDENENVLFTADASASDIDKLLSLEVGDKSTITFTGYAKDDVVMKVKVFRLTSTLENSKRIENPVTATDDLEAVDDLEGLADLEGLDDLEALGKAAEAVGAMAGAAAKAADAANEISKRK